jgi:glyoxylase-like metal-dependent hydrolase (beta-lactamase superfamily II)
MPLPDPLRFGPSTLIEAGSQKILADAGRGATMRLFQLRIPIGSIDLLLTHFHSDHVVGLPDIWLTVGSAAGISDRLRNGSAPCSLARVDAENLGSKSRSYTPGRSPTRPRPGSLSAGRRMSKPSTAPKKLISRPSTQPIEKPRYPASEA